MARKFGQKFLKTIISFLFKKNRSFFFIFLVKGIKDKRVKMFLKSKITLKKFHFDQIFWPKRFFHSEYPIVIIYEKKKLTLFMFN